MNRVLRHIGDLVSGALAFVLTLTAASSCLGERQGPDSFDISQGFCFVIGPDEGAQTGSHEDSGSDLFFESSQDTVSFHGVVFDEGLMNEPSTKTIYNLSLNMFDSSRLYEETSEHMSLGVFGASAVHGSSFTGLDLCDDYYFTKRANSYYFYGPELNTRLSLQFDVKFWAYYPKFRAGDGGLYDGTGFENGKPYVDFHNCSDANADVGSEYDFLYGSSSVIYGSELGAVPMPLNHALAAFVVGISDDNGCDFGEISKVRICNVYNRGRFYLDGTWSSCVSDPDIVISSYDDIDVDVASGDSSSDLLSDDGFCAFMIPQTCPEGAALEIDFNDGYSIRTMSASLEGLTFVDGHVYKLLINPDFDSNGYVHLQHDTNIIHVPWIGGSYGYNTEDMDDLAVWCTCGNNYDFITEVESNTGVVFSSLHVFDVSAVDFRYDFDDCDWFRNNWSEDCSRLQMVIAPNLSSSQVEAFVNIICIDDPEHKPYELHIIQDGNPNAGSYYLNAKDVEIPFNPSNSYRSSFLTRIDDFFDTNIRLDNSGVDYFSEGGLSYSLSKNIKFSFDKSASSDSRDHNLSYWFDYYESNEYQLCDRVYIYYDRNFSLVDVWIPYTVSIGTMSSSAYIILKAGNFSYRSLSLSPASLEFVYGTSYSELRSYFNYRTLGNSSDYSILLYAYNTSVSAYSPSLTFSDSSIAYWYYGRYIKARNLGETEAVVQFQGLEARATVRVVPPSLSVTPDLQTLQPTGGTSSYFTVSCNTRWRMTQKPSWVLSLSGITMNTNYSGNRSSNRFIVSQNTGGPREGYLVFQTVSGYGTPQQTVRMTVRQQGAGGVSLEEWGDGSTDIITW